MWQRFIPWCAALLAFQAAALTDQVPSTPHTSRVLVELGDDSIPLAISERWVGATAIEMAAECVIPRPAEAVWDVLSDYNHLAEFIPFLTESHVVRHEGTAQILHQRGRVSFLVFHRGFWMTFHVEEMPPYDIRFEAFEGDFKQFKGVWHLEAHSDGTLVRHKVLVEPAFFIPRWIRRIMARHILLTSLEGVIRRCMR